MPHRKYKSNTNKRKTKKANQKQSKIFKIKIKKHRRKISFRKNKNNNLRTKSLKKIGGAHGDKAEDFGFCWTSSPGVHVDLSPNRDHKILLVMHIVCMRCSCSNTRRKHGN